MEEIVKNQKRILLIEDDDYIADIYSSELERAGYAVEYFRTGEDGLKALAEKNYDLLLLDIMLPGINGLDVLTKIKADPKTKDLKVLVLTNLGNDPIVKQAYKMGAVGLLIKASINPDQVIAQVQKTLAEPPKPPVN